MAGAVFGGFYLLFNEASWLSYPVLPAPALLSIVHPGETMPLLIARHSTASEKRTYTMSRELHCDSVARPIQLPAVPASVMPGYSEITSYINEVPRFIADDNGRAISMPSGICFVAGIAEVNGLVRNNIPVYWYSTQFRVVANP